MLGLPLFLVIMLKANAAIIFFTACAGIVLLSSLDPSVVTTAGAVIPGEGEGYIRLSVVVLSFVVGAILSRGSVRKASSYLLHGLLVLFTALTLWALLPMLTGVSWLHTSTEQATWQTVDDFKTMIIALGFSLSLVVLLRQSGIRHSKKH